MRARPTLPACLALLATCLASAAPAGAAAPDFLLQVPADSTAPGEGAGEFHLPRGVVADPGSGHIYVSDLQNVRISEFTAWGVFVKAWGWDVAPEGAPGDTPSDELETCTATCKAGIAGNGAGQMNDPIGIALNSSGDLYVFESSPGVGPRVQKFDPNGDFLLMFGGEVNKTSGANLCTKADLEAGDECGAGVAGTADGFLSSPSGFDLIDFNPATGTIFVGDADRIQEFGADGSFQGKIDFEGPLAALDGKSVRALAADPSSGDLYFITKGLASVDDDVKRLDLNSGEVTDMLAAEEPTAVTVDADGNVYAFGKAPFVWAEVLGFGPSGAPLTGMEAGDRFASPPFVNGSAAIPAGLATNVLGPGSEEPGDLYVTYTPSPGAYLNAFGPAPVAFEDPPAAAPEISAQYATAVGTDAATVRAEINPRFWQDATYYLQYGTKACPEAGWEGPACTEKPAAPGALLSAKSLNKPVRTAAVSLAGLQPDTEYRYRFVTESGGGGPVFGAERGFHTFALPDASEACANGAFRVGPSAKLPDCRAYELVSPLEKGGGGASQLGESSPVWRETTQSALSGERLAFTSKTAFAGTQSTPWVSNYIASRKAQVGWSTEAISPLRTHTAVDVLALSNNDYQLFSPDLCTGWLLHLYEPTLAPGAVEGYANIYERDNCSEPATYEPLTTVEPPNRSAFDYAHLQILGSSDDGAHTIFNADGKLTEEAPALPNLGETLLYEHLAGVAEPRFVCILPSGNPSGSPCGAGRPAGQAGGKDSNLQGAISADGSRIFFTTFSGTVVGDPTGHVYLRLDGAETISVSREVTNEPALFWGAAKDGSRAIFEVTAGPVTAGPLKDNLYSFDVEKALAEEPGAATLIAKGVSGVAGISEDASRVYFASREDLTGEEENGEGEKAQAGQPNLYLYEGGEFTFVARLAELDLISSEANPGPLDPRPSSHATRIAPDGRSLAFISRAPLTGYDNSDAESGQPAAEVFLYDAEEEKLRCVSCNPTGARPLSGHFPIGMSGAATIAPWERPTYASRLLSDDGERLFFESREALVPTDTNRAVDVYQWEEEGKGSCSPDDPTHNPDSEGCIELISSGESPEDSKFLDADPSGNNVFFATLASLVPQDYGLVDIYDARIGGGLPSPQPRSACEGTSCQPASAPPDFPRPASAAYEGPANPKATRPRCPKGKRRVKGRTRTRCVPKRKRHIKQTAVKGRAR